MISNAEANLALVGIQILILNYIPTSYVIYKK